MATKSKDEKVMTKNGHELTTAAPTEIAPYKMNLEDQAAMYGDMDSEDLSIPRITILQGLSPEVTDGLGSPGDLFVKGLNYNLGKAPLEIIPLMRNKSRTRWKPLDDGGGVLCQAPEGKHGIGDPGGECEVCRFREWTIKDPKTGKLKPGCDLYQNIICVLRKETEWMPMALSGSRTKLKPMKDLNRLIMLEQQNGRPIFGKSYLVKPVKKSSGQITYFNLSISTGNGNQMLPDLEIQKAAKLFQSLRGKKIRIDQTENDHAENFNETPSI